MVHSGAIVSNLHLRNVEVPENTVWHGMTLKDGTSLIRVYGVLDNPKGRLQNDAGYLGTTLQVFIEKNKLVPLLVALFHKVVRLIYMKF